MRRVIVLLPIAYCPLPIAFERLKERDRQEAAPGKEAEEQHGEIEEDRKPMALHRVQKPTDRMSLRRRCIVGTADRQHRGVPGERQQEKKQRTAEREAALPKLAPATRYREVRHHC